MSQFFADLGPIGSTFLNVPAALAFRLGSREIAGCEVDRLLNAVRSSDLADASQS